jgi:hypothetical protein
MSSSEHFTFSSFCFLHIHVSVSFAKRVFKHPMLFSGPHNPINNVNNPRENNKENPMVQNINTPNCMCLLVGLAVDYVVHLAEGYHLSLHKDRLSRTRDMLEEMGTSVFSGACTTLGDTKDNTYNNCKKKKDKQ